MEKKGSFRMPTDARLQSIAYVGSQPTAASIICVFSPFLLKNKTVGDQAELEKIPSRGLSTRHFFFYARNLDPHVSRNLCNVCDKSEASRGSVKQISHHTLTCKTRAGYCISFSPDKPNLCNNSYPHR